MPRIKKGTAGKKRKQAVIERMLEEKARHDVIVDTLKNVIEEQRLNPPPVLPYPSWYYCVDR